jgi:hypothetical protein
VFADVVRQHELEKQQVSPQGEEVGKRVPMTTMLIPVAEG